MDHESVVIQTPEYVEIEYELAGLGTRLVACLLDTLVQTAIVFVIVIVIAAVFQMELSLGIEGSPVDLVTWIIIGGISLFNWIGYWVISEMVTGGKSIGKISVGLRVIRDDGTPISFWDSMLRNIVRIVDMLPGNYLVGIVSIWVSKQSKRVGDYAAGTVVVKERSAPLPVPAPPPPPTAEARPSSPLHDLLRPHVHRLTDEQVAALKRFLRRRDELDSTVRTDLARRLGSSISQHLSVPVTNWAAVEDFLAAAVDCHDEASNSKL